MYELADPTMESDLVADARRGVKVRVLLDTNREQSRNMAAFDTLRAGGVKVVWADTSYEATHQKTISVDDAKSLILTGNLTSEYYTTTATSVCSTRTPRCGGNRVRLQCRLRPQSRDALRWGRPRLEPRLGVGDAGRHRRSQAYLVDRERGDG